MLVSQQHIFSFGTYQIELNLSVMRTFSEDLAKFLTQVWPNKSERYVNNMTMSRTCESTSQLSTLLL